MRLVGGCAAPSITVTTRASREDPHGSRALISEGTYESVIAQEANPVIRQIVTSLSVVRHQRPVTVALRSRGLERYPPVGLILNNSLTRRIHKIGFGVLPRSIEECILRHG
ncbi:hypothetical protein VA596_03290 [Amycolatopsis sp., V23-08]|uniref:Uncharacterized protein n=1 Tax=Amycolatopsis heterodermiae TaxID=3110235 RepID=A0ABU5QXF1_9PSEU|nr:hypothetical protein [Amycolatopsis sp., V23-08]MEA5358548.1 hypothetical protein [Amycolatopsis sp., V23-08]